MRFIIVCIIIALSFVCHGQANTIKLQPISSQSTVSHYAENRTDTVLGRIMYVKRKTVKTAVIPIMITYYNSRERGVGQDYKPILKKKKWKILSITLCPQ